MTFTTDDGSTIEVTRCVEGFDLHLRNAEGDSVATVRLPEGKAPLALLAGVTDSRESVV